MRALPVQIIEHHFANIRSVASKVPVARANPIAAPVSRPVVSTPVVSKPVVSAPINFGRGITKAAPTQPSSNLNRPTAVVARSRQVMGVTDPSRAGTDTSLAPISGLTLPAIVSQPANTVVPQTASNATSTNNAMALYNNYLSQLQQIAGNTPMLQSSVSGNAGTSSQSTPAVSVASANPNSVQIPDIYNLQNNSLSPTLNYSPTPFTAPSGFSQFATSNGVIYNG